MASANAEVVSGGKPSDVEAKQTRDQTQLKKAVSYFISETSSTKTRGNIKLQEFLETIEAQAQRNGLAPEIINDLAKCAASSRFSETVSIRLIKSLIPSSTVPEDAVVRVISLMCTNKPSTTIQMWLVRWIILVYEFIESKEKLHALYGILFLFIENEKMCPHLCHLLYLMTRKEDVKHYRIRKLIDLQARTGVQAHILGLLSVYKLYHPHLVTLSTSVGDKRYFRQTDRKWSETIRRIAEAGCQMDRRQQDVGVLRETELLASGAKKAKRRKVDVVPGVVTNLGQTRDLQVMQVSTKKVPMEQIQTFQQLSKNFDRLELPNQIASLLKSPHLQQVLSCMSEQTVFQRLSYWLYMTLYTEIIDYPMEKSNLRAEYLLQLLIDFTDFIQESIPVCEFFLTKYLHSWNGSVYRPYILQLITRFRLLPFQKMNDLLLEPLRKLFFCSSVYFKCQVLYSFTTLLKNFVSIEWPRYKSRGLRLDTIASTTLEINETFVFGEPMEEFNAADTIIDFIQFVDGLCSVGLQVEGGNTLLMHHALTFYELVSKIHTVYGFPCMCLPSKGIALRAVYSNDATAVSRLCQLLCSYKHEIDHMKTLHEEELTTSSMEIIPELNGYILHISDLLWRNRAFQTTGLVTIEAKDFNATDFRASFSIWEHPALQSYASAYNIQTGSALQDKSTAKDYLKFLKSQHLDGIDEFITTYIKGHARKSP